jgi:hypothetical protein
MFEYNRVGALPAARRDEEDRSMTVIRHALAPILMVAGLGILVAACDSTPTVPVPPPEFCAASAPDEFGLCTVGCDGGQTIRNVALVYNEEMGQGLMRETEEDGSFSLEIAAEVGDTLLVQIKHDNKLSGEVVLTVPAE